MYFLRVQGLELKIGIWSLQLDFLIRLVTKIIKHMSCGQSPSNYNCLSCSYSRTSDALRPDDIGQNFYLVKISKDFHMSLLFKRIKNKMLNVFKISHCILSNVGEV